MAKEFNQEASELLVKLASENKDVTAALQAGADPNYRDKQGLSALDHATAGAHDTGRYTMNGNNISALIEAGANPYAAVVSDGHPLNGKTPFQNMLLEVERGSEYHGITELELSAINANTERPQAFLDEVHRYRPHQTNSLDSRVTVGYLRNMVEGRNAFLQQHAAAGIPVEAPAPVSAPRGSGTWTDSIETVGATTHSDRFGGSTGIVSTRGGLQIK